MKQFENSYNPVGLIDKSIISNVEKVLSTGRLYRYDCQTPDQSEVSLLEKEFAEMLGVKYAVAVNSCSSSIFLALISSGVKAGDKVLIPAFTFIAVPSAVVHVGAIPVLVEINENYTLDVDDLKRKITSETKYLLLSYMRGHIPNLDEIISICDSSGIILIEDCAHSLGVTWNKIPTGSFGKIGCFSMQSYKILDGGEGGILITDDEDIYAQSILYSGSYERLWTKHFSVNSNFAKYQKSIPCYNFRMSNLTASVIRPQLSLINERIDQYNTKYRFLAGSLAKSPHIDFPMMESKSSLVGDSVQFNLIGLSLEQMKRFLALAKSCGLPIDIFGLSEDNARCYWNWNFLNSNDELPKTRSILLTTCDMRLPLCLSMQDISDIGETLIEIIETVIS